MLEKEWKWLVTREKFEAMRKLAVYFSGTTGHIRLQINHYYDTIDRKMAAQNICVRIRQTEERLAGTVKKHGEKGVSEESAFQTETLPRFITYENILLHRLGALVTQRTDFEIGEIATLSFDENYYLGKTDYEIELEFLDHKSTVNLDEWYRAFFHDDCSNSKYERFLTALDRFERESGAGTQMIEERNGL